MIDYQEICNMEINPFDRYTLESVYDAFFTSLFNAYLCRQLMWHYFCRMYEKFGYPSSIQPEKIFLLQDENYKEELIEEFFDVFYEQDDENCKLLSSCLEETNWKMEMYSIDFVRAEFTDGDLDTPLDEEPKKKDVKKVIKRLEGDFCAVFTNMFVEDINLKYSYVCVFTNEKLGKYLEATKKYKEDIAKYLKNESEKINTVYDEMYVFTRFFSWEQGIYKGQYYRAYTLGTYEDSGECCSFFHLNPNFLVQIFILDHLLDDFLPKLEKIINKNNLELQG